MLGSGTGIGVPMWNCMTGELEPDRDDALTPQDPNKKILLRIILV